MKILHVNDIASVASTLAAAQRRAGHEVKVEQIIPAQGRGRWLDKLRTLGARAGAAWRVRRTIALWKPDVVHLHYATSALWFVGIRAPRLVHAHGSDIRLPRSDQLRRALIRIGLSGTAALLYSTPDLEPYARALRPDAVFLPNPVDVAAFANEPVDIAGKRAEDDVRVLWFAVPTAVKGAEHAVAALRILAQRFPHWRLTVLRSPALAGFLPEPHEPALQVIDPVPPSHVPELLARHDLVLGQFFLGAMGTAELQAMTSARPVVCHFVFDAAYPEPAPLLLANSCDSIVEAVRAWFALDAPARRAWLQRARAWVADHHDASMVAAQLQSVYDACIARPETAVHRRPASGEQRDSA